MEKEKSIRKTNDRELKRRMFLWRKNVDRCNQNIRIAACLGYVLLNQGKPVRDAKGRWIPLDSQERFRFGRKNPNFGKPIEIDGIYSEMEHRAYLRLLRLKRALTARGIMQRLDELEKIDYA